jgi:HK97 family phage major capsid protein
MPNYVDELRAKRDELVDQFDETARRIKALPDDATDEERTSLKARFERLQGSVTRLTEDVKNAEAVTQARLALAPQDEDEKPDAEGRKRLTVREPFVYEREAPHSYFQDLVQAHNGNSIARERLDRHMLQMRTERRDITTVAGAGGEFVAPQYLNDQWITLARAGRVTANLPQNRGLVPGRDGQVLHFPRLSGGSAVAVQTADNAAVQETDPTTGDYSVTVATIAGQVDLSRQLYDFSNPGMDEIIFTDLAADFATKLDIQVISGSGGSGQVRGIRNIASINNVTYTQATPTTATLFPKVADAVQRVATTLYRYPDAIVMHPVRWASFLGAVDTAGRPLVPPEGAFNPIIRNGTQQAEGLVGSLQGLPVYVDPNLPTNLGAGTNQDIVIAARFAEMYLYEEAGGPRTRVFEDVGSGTQTVRISAWGYVAFAAGRYPAAISLISGTGLVPPTF